MRECFKLQIIVFSWLYYSVCAQNQVYNFDTQTIKDSSQKTGIAAEPISKKKNLEKNYNSIMSVNPLELLIFYNISFYQKISNNSVLGVSVQVPVKPDIDFWGLNLEFRFHTSNNAIQGFYFAPNFTFYFDNFGLFPKKEIYFDNKKEIEFWLGIMFGWQWITQNDLSYGFGYGFDYVTYDNPFSHIIPNFRIDVGYAW